MCKGPVAGGSPAHSRSKVGMAGAGTAGRAWGNFLMTSQGGLGIHQKGLEEQGEEYSLFPESSRRPLTGFIREATRPGPHC